jgi:hypothetical protein
MSFINISAVYTADPGNVWVPKSAFMTGDPFAIVLNIQADSSLVSEGLLFDAVFQIVNPQQDPYGRAWWTYTGSDILSMPSVDVDWDAISFQWGTNFAIWWSWPQYANAVSQIGGYSIRGVFYVQGSVSVEGSDLFANSGQFWFKTR